MEYPLSFFRIQSAYVVQRPEIQILFRLRLNNQNLCILEMQYIYKIQRILFAVAKFVIPLNATRINSIQIYPEV